MTEENSLTIHTPESMQPKADPLAFLTDSGHFEHVWRVATAFSKSRLVPTHFQNKPEDTFVAIQMALQLDVNPLLCLQNTQVINGRPSFSSPFMIGLANTRGPFRGPLTWHTTGEGDDLSVTCMACLKLTGEVVKVTVSMAMAKAEGWTKNAKYRSIPEQMLRYRSATWLIRLYCPEVTCGMQSDDEVRDVKVQVVDASVEAPQLESDPVAALNQQLVTATEEPAKAEPAEVIDEQIPLVQDQPDAASMF